MAVYPDEVVVVEDYEDEDEGRGRSKRGKKGKKGKKKKKEFGKQAEEGIKKVFSFLKNVTYALRVLLEKTAEFAVYLFNQGLKLFLSPFTITAITIGLTGAVLIATGYAWFELGRTVAIVVARFAPGTTAVFATEIGFLVIGLVINAFQIFPNLWKLSRDVASGTLDAGINTKFEPEDENDVSERLNNWDSFAHWNTRNLRRNAYIAELFFVAMGTFARVGTRLATGGIAAILMDLALGAVALWLPERTVEMMIAVHNWSSSVAESYRKAQEKKDEQVESIRF